MHWIWSTIALPDISWVFFHSGFHSIASGVLQAIERPLGTVASALLLGNIS